MKNTTIIIPVAIKEGMRDFHRGMLLNLDTTITRADVEIIVVDYGCTEDTDFLVDYADKFAKIESESLDEAVAAGKLAASCRYVCIMDPNTKHKAPGWIEDRIRALSPMQFYWEEKPEVRANKVLITGINGFAASHLARYLLELGYEVHGTIRVRSDLHRISDIVKKIKMHQVELTDYLSVEHVILNVKPDQIYHLAAQSTVRPSWDMPSENYRINVDGTINVLESCRKLTYKPEILNVSTSESYGDTGEEITEETAQRPNTHYGVSKTAQDMIGRMYFKAYGLPVVTSRSFNITGPGRADAFVDSNFAKQVAEIEKGIVSPAIRHGNLTSKRDFTDVRDVVRAYVMIMESKRFGEIFNICTGKSHSIQEVLSTLVSLSTSKDISTEVDPERFRPIDTKDMICKGEKIRELGWTPKIRFEESMEALLNYWRNRI